MNIETKIIENFKLIDEKIGNLNENIEKIIYKEVEKHINVVKNSNLNLEKFSKEFEEESKNFSDKISKLDGIEKSILKENKSLKSENKSLKQRLLKSEGKLDKLEEKLNSIDKNHKKQAENLQSLEEKIKILMDFNSDAKIEEQDNGLAIKKDDKVVNITINI